MPSRPDDIRPKPCARPRYRSSSSSGTHTHTLEADEGSAAAAAAAVLPPFIHCPPPPACALPTHLKLCEPAMSVPARPATVCVGYVGMTCMPKAADTPSMAPSRIMTSPPAERGERG